mmetsp:Transcript_116438/g.336356  ORF Transcript_116438/g.336356 Transcript_116438/m.336356 type:complete len:223 (+) Transcript_116438:355-1023(+)
MSRSCSARSWSRGTRRCSAWSRNNCNSASPSGSLASSSWSFGACSRRSSAQRRRRRRWRRRPPRPRAPQMTRGPPARAPWPSGRRGRSAAQRRAHACSCPTRRWPMSRSMLPRWLPPRSRERGRRPAGGLARGPGMPRQRAPAGGVARASPTRGRAGLDHCHLPFPAARGKTAAMMSLRCLRGYLWQHPRHAPCRAHPANAPRGPMSCTRRTSTGNTDGARI